MRTYGRVWDTSVTPPKPTWVEVSTDAAGFDDYVWITTLCQCLLLNVGESPFYATYGIPAKPAIVQQVFPDFYVSLMQQKFAPHFASLIVSRQQLPTPVYQINVTTNQGVKVAAEIPT